MWVIEDVEVEEDAEGVKDGRGCDGGVVYERDATWEVSDH